MLDQELIEFEGHDKDSNIVLKGNSLQQIVSWRIREEKVIILVISATVIVTITTASISIVVVAAEFWIVKNILMFINLVLLES